MKSKIVVITDVESNKGRYTAEQLIKLGHRVIMLCSSKKKEVKVREEILQNFPGADFYTIAGSLSEPENIVEVCNEITNQFDNIDVLINNASIFRKKKSFK